MPYGIIKVDQVTFTNAGVDQTISVSGIVASISGNITATGTISGNVIRGGTTVSGATVTGNAGQFNTITGNIASFTSGVFAAGSATTPSISFTGDDNTGIYSPGADQVAITTSGTGRLFIDSSGRLLVGTSTARSNFFGTTLSSLTQTEGTGGSTARGALSVINNDVSNNPPYVLLGRSGAATLGSNAAVVSGSRLGTLTFHGADGTSFIEAATVAGEVDGTPGTNDMPGRLVFSTTADGAASPTERMRITSAGLVGIGTSSPSSPLHLSTGSAAASALFASTDTTAYSATSFLSSARLRITGGSATNAYNGITFGNNSNAEGFIGFVQNASGYGDFVVQSYAGSYAEKLRVTSTGNVGIGVTAPGQLLQVGSANGELRIGGSAGLDITHNNSGSTTAEIKQLYAATSASAQLKIISGFTSFHTGTSGTEAARIDSSGRLLVGTSTARAVGGLGTASFQQESTGYEGASASWTLNQNTGDSPWLVLAKSRGTSLGSFTVVNSGDALGRISFQGADGSVFRQGASIFAEADAAWSSGDAPGRLVFSTTADGASSPTERMRIQSSGAILIAKTTDDTNTQGIRFSQFGVGSFSRDADIPLFINRNTDDGGLVVFRQGGVDEGSISVSGTTVSYNGAHLSRWSQLPSGAERTEILRGSVLSNIDEMCEWADEDNEQLNRMKVSDVEGDKNVSGVFQAWDDDDDTYTNDFYCAMTGDFIIRIAEGVTVERGDLLMSAGDGTAKPQDDDIIRSKTIAKVTSTNVSCTYEDGSYCVPCVLMAC